MCVCISVSKLLTSQRGMNGRINEGVGEEEMKGGGAGGGGTEKERPPS